MSAAAALGFIQMSYPLGMYELDSHRHNKIPYFTKDMVTIGNLRQDYKQAFVYILPHFTDFFR